MLERGAGAHVQRAQRARRAARGSASHVAPLEARPARCVLGQRRRHARDRNTHESRDRRPRPRGRAHTDGSRLDGRERSGGERSGGARSGGARSGGQMTPHDCSVITHVFCMYIFLFIMSLSLGTAWFMYRVCPIQRLPTPGNRSTRRYTVSSRCREARQLKAGAHVRTLPPAATRQSQTGIIRAASCFRPPPSTWQGSMTCSTQPPRVPVSV